MGKYKGFISILIPSLTVFLSSGCIMVIELVAGRLVARHLGSSLYTWTSVIGVVLAGITIGNYFGGRIADRFEARKALSVLFGISSLACVGIIFMNNIVGDWMLLWFFNWPLRVFTHICLVFLIPSTLLGTISPVVAKMALDRGLSTGRTIGDIYAWGAAGSIAGTFVAGFYLIATMGTIAIIWTVGLILLLIGILYWTRFWALYVWAAIFIILMVMGMAPGQWAEQNGSSFKLRRKPSPDIIYEDESQYCYISVKRVSDEVDKRVFMQDKLAHSRIVMDDILNLQYSYAQIQAAVTRLLNRQNRSLSVLVIGGGGYVFPRYVEKVWPGSRVDVAEIDPGVTEAAMQAFGLERDTAINTFAMDGRNYVSQLLEQQRRGGQKVQYDFIYEDAINDYSIPYQLVTKEFDDKITQILTDNGVYMTNLIDIYNSGLFVGALINTMEQTFPHVYVVTEQWPDSMRNTFVVIGAKQPISLENLGREEPVRKLDLWILSDSEKENLKQKANGIILTDNYAPVDNMVTPVVHQYGLEFLSKKYREYAENLKLRGRLEESIAVYQELVRINPVDSIVAYEEIAAMRGQQGRLNEAVQAFRRAIEYNQKTGARVDLASIHLGLGLLLKDLGQSEEPTEHFYKAIEGFRKKLSKNPESLETNIEMGIALAEVGQFGEATGYLKRAVDMNPLETAGYLALARTYLVQQLYDEAIELLREGIGLMLQHGRKSDASELQKALASIQAAKSAGGQ